MIELLFVLFLLSLLVLAILALSNGRFALLRRIVPLFLLGSALLGLVIGGYCLLNGKIIELDYSSYLPFAFGFSVDRLTAFFLVLISGLAAPVALFSGSYTEHYSATAWKWYWFLLPLFVLSMAVVVAASTAFAFMLGWELMTLFSAGLILIEGDSADRKRTLFIYLAMMQAGAAAVLATFLLFVPHAPTLSFAGMRAAGGALPGSLRNAIFLLSLFGFGIKAGIVPLHFWLPKAHAVAPSPVSALMSGIMLKTAIYGFLRLSFDILGIADSWWGYLVLAAGIITAVLGVLYALAEQTLKRLLAYSSIENIGLVYLAIGLAMVFRAHGLPVLAALSLVAALLHSLNHALFKGLLFLGSGAVYRSTRTLNMEELGGLLSRLSGIGISVLIGCAAIAGLPLLNGFVSEWLIFKSLLNGSALGPTPALPLLIGALALTSALVCACFVKFYGITFLGRPRSTAAEQAHAVPENMDVSLFVLACLCILLGVHPGVVLNPLYRVTETLVPNTTPPSELAAISHTMPLVAAAVAVVVMIALRLRSWSSRRVETWACGLPSLTPRMEYTATSFSKPLRSVFTAVYKPARKVDIEPAGERYFPVSISYRSVRTTSFEKVLYRPTVDFVVAAARQLRRLHTGNIQAYLLYIFLIIVCLLLVLRFV